MPKQEFVSMLGNRKFTATKSGLKPNESVVFIATGLKARVNQEVFADNL